MEHQVTNKLNFILPLKGLQFRPRKIWAQLFCPNTYIQSICNVSLIKLFRLLPVNRNIAKLHRGSGSLKALQIPDGKCDRKLNHKHFLFLYILITFQKSLLPLISFPQFFLARTFHSCTNSYTLQGLLPIKIIRVWYIFYYQRQQKFFFYVEDRSQNQ